MVLTAKIDGYFDPREELVIKEHFKDDNIGSDIYANLMVEIDKIPTSHYEQRLKICATEYYHLSSQEDRKDLILSLMKLINADEEIKTAEYLAFNLLYKLWDIKK